MKYILAFWNALCALNRLPLHKDYIGTYRGGHSAAPVGRSHAPDQPRSTCPTAPTWFRTRQDAHVAPMMCDCAPKAIQARIPCRKAGSHSALSAMMLPCSSSCSIPPIPRCPFKYRRSLSIPAVRNRARIHLQELYYPFAPRVLLCESIT